MRGRARQLEWVAGELDEINHMRAALGLPPAPLPKLRKCLRCRREFKHEIARVCAPCKEHNENYKSVSTLSGYDVID